MTIVDVTGSRGQHWIFFVNLAEKIFLKLGMEELP